MTVHELQRKRTDLAARIKTAGAKFSRDTGWPSDADKKAYDQANEEYNLVARDLELADAEARDDKRAVNNPHGLGREDRGGSVGAGQSNVHSTPDGSQQVRMVGRDESFIDPQARTDTSGFSIGKLAVGMATGRWHGAELEHRTLNETAGSAGGMTIPSEVYGTLIDRARAQSVCMKAGAITIPVNTENLRVCRVLTDPTPRWRAETQTATESDGTFESVILRPKMVYILTSATVELIEDSPLAAQMIEDTMFRTLAVEMDRVALAGDGQNSEPYGILSDSGINTTASVTGALAYDEVLTAFYEVQADNLQPNAIVANPREHSVLRKLKDGNGDYLGHHEDISKLKILSTSSMPITQGGGSAASIIVGDFTKLVFGIRTTARLEAFRGAYTATTNGLTQLAVHFRLYARMDVCLLQPKAFCSLTGITS